MNGSAGLTMFNETVAKVKKYKQLLSKSQKLRLAALERKAVRQDTFGDWSALINEVFNVWEEALRGRSAAQPVIGK